MDKKEKTLIELLSWFIKAAKDDPDLNHRIQYPDLVKNRLLGELQVAVNGLLTHLQAKEENECKCEKDERKDKKGGGKVKKY
jgi:hypothetical protein